MSSATNEIRLALPSKGPLAEDTLALMAAAGLAVHHANPRQYWATIPNMPGLGVLFQRPGDIVVSVRDGSVDFGITGADVLAEKQGEQGEILVIHPALGFGQCALHVIIPESGNCPSAPGLCWEDIQRMTDLARLRAACQRTLRVATKFPRLARAFFTRHGLEDTEFITAEGTLEIAPTIGYADLITDLVSTGITLRDNRLRRLEDGLILSSQACLVANRASLQDNRIALGMARTLLEFIVAHLRAREHVMVFANMRGETMEEIAGRMFTKSVIGGLQGPTLSPVASAPQAVGMSGIQDLPRYAANLVVRKDQLALAIAELREVGGSGVVVTPCTYIFEEEPAEYRLMLNDLQNGSLAAGGM
ncbi:MAG: ATP phosphoribosyltransferase [Bellilinea sp.]